MLINRQQLQQPKFFANLKMSPENHLFLIDAVYEGPTSNYRERKALSHEIKKISRTNLNPFSYFRPSKYPVKGQQGKHFEVSPPRNNRNGY